MIRKGTPEFRRYWRAWYNLERSWARLKVRGSERRALHARFGLPISHKEFSDVELRLWERRCQDEWRERLLEALAAQSAALSTKARKDASRAIRENLRLAADVTLEDLNPAQLAQALALLQRISKAKAPG